MSKQHNGRPAYRYHSMEWGVAFLYFENLTPTEQYWVIGPTLGSADANLGAASLAASPDQVRSVLEEDVEIQMC